MQRIVLTTLNARYAHTSFGLRYLMANLGEVAADAVMLEFDISQRTTDVIEQILAQDPKIVGIGVYIWNAEQSLKLVADLKRIRPDLTVILGGPEVSYETDQQAICSLADYIITGEGDIAFRELCRKLLAGQRPLIKIIPGSEGAFDDANSGAVELPYHLYTDNDLAHRVIYVEASRGCPFKCEFCLSSLDTRVRAVPMARFLPAMQNLLDRGAREFKFVDRTFNLHLPTASAILEFFLERLRPDLFLHFEMIPDRMPDGLRALIQKFPPGVLQFEVGIQTFDDDVSNRISRRQDIGRLEANLRWLAAETGVHVHADLIVGLPGEDIESFAKGFDRLVALGPQEIQVGMLKRLRGTPIIRHDAEWGMTYRPHAPYEILTTKSVDFTTMQRLRRFSRYWDLVANSGNFVLTIPLLWRDSSPFEQFMRLSDWLFQTAKQTHAISLTNLAELLFRFLTEQRNIDAKLAAETIWSDFQRIGRSDQPPCMKPYLSSKTAKAPLKAASRQERHLAR